MESQEKHIHNDYNHDSDPDHCVLCCSQDFDDIKQKLTTTLSERDEARKEVKKLNELYYKSLDLCVVLKSQSAQIEKLKEGMGELVKAASGYLGNGHEPTDGDIVHQPEHCRQCNLEEAITSARKVGM